MSATEKRRIHSASSSSSILSRRTPQYRMEIANSRREAAIRKNEFWTHTSNYFQALAQQNDRYEAWNSNDVAKKW